MKVDPALEHYFDTDRVAVRGKSHADALDQNSRDTAFYQALSQARGQSFDVGKLSPSQPQNPQLRYAFPYDSRSKLFDLSKKMYVVVDVDHRGAARRKADGTLSYLDTKPSDEVCDCDEQKIPLLNDGKGGMWNEKLWKNLQEIGATHARFEYNDTSKTGIFTAFKNVQLNQDGSFYGANVAGKYVLDQKGNVMALGGGQGSFQSCQHAFPPDPAKIPVPHVTSPRVQQQAQVNRTPPP